MNTDFLGTKGTSFDELELPQKVAAASDGKRDLLFSGKCGALPGRRCAKHKSWQSPNLQAMR